MSAHLQQPPAGTSAYDAARRVLLCEQCGAPVDVSGSAPQVSCSYCRATLQVRMRPEAAAAPRRAQSEAERLALLSAQDRRFVPPQSLAHLFAGERVAPACESEARARFQQLRSALGQEANTASSDELFFLTLGLSELLFERGELLAQRGVVDSALELLPSAEHRQVLRAQLARCAQAAGDLAAAEAWLRLCNAYSEDLLADTAYRFARGYLDTARGDFAAVIRALGTGGSATSDAYGPECAVLLANAWERAGQTVTAIDTLVYAKRDLGPVARRRVRRFIVTHAHWRLCARAELESERRMERMDLPPEGGDTTAGTLLIVMGAGGVLMAVSGVILGLLLPVGCTPFLVGTFSGLLLAVLLLAIGATALSSARSTKDLRRSELAYPARILRCTPSEADLAFQVVLEVEMLLLPDDAPAYLVRDSFAVIREMAENFAVGRVLIARVNPSDRMDVLLDVV